MDADLAAERLQVIRTLMERSAIYRRALAPVMTFLGVLGLAAGAGGALLSINSPRRFIAYWSSVGMLGLIGAYALTRQQALKDREPFWSPPTKRVTLALVPPLFVGAVIGAILCATMGTSTRFAWALPVSWVLLYGCALHSAGFFTPRGMKLLGALFICGGSSLSLGCIAADAQLPLSAGHLVMGFFFGALQLAYGIYLHLTDKTQVGK
jgi:hypothetical protein